MSNHSPLFLFILMIFIAFASLTFACNNENSHDVSARYRLPKNIVPISYDLSIYTHPVDADYNGHVRIILRVLEKTDFIVLHVDALRIQANASLSDRSGRLTRILRYTHDEGTHMLTIKLERALSPAQYTLEVSFKGRIANDVFGFYASLYEVDGKLRRIGVTQFSPTYARRAFPCMDEPYLKAEFQLHIGHHKDQKATSNTPVESIRTENDTYHVTTFRRTPRISTYLVGWTVHNFVVERSRISEDFKMWTRDSMKLRGSTALNRGQAVYSALQTWLVVKSPLVKVDQFAIPDFNFNAMENWGLITYRESVVLHEHGTPTRKLVDGLSTMAHEYAHSWFGNLVTPEFWDVVWLKEGFATYFQYFGVSLAEPDLRMMNVFVVDCLQPTLLADSDNHTRTLNGREVGSRDSIMATLDFVSYKKGASIIRMINHTIGSIAFQLGLQNYLREMSYQAATPSDLYRHLQTALNKSEQLYRQISIKDIVESWANQPGYPLVIITRNYTTKTLFASQERFYLNRQAEQLDSEKSGWWIPLTFVTEKSNSVSDRTTTAVWLKPQDKSTIIGSVETNSWVICNIQQIGYYRVNYDKNNWEMLTHYLKLKNFKKIHVINRAALLDDAFNLARAGYVDYSIPFTLARYLTRETDYEPWVAAVNNFNFLNHVLACSPRVQRLFQNYANRLLKPIYGLLSFVENSVDSSIAKLHRELILSTACSVNNVHCLKTSKALFNSWILSEKSTIPANLKSFVYCVGIRTGNDNDWHTVWKRFLRTDLHAEQELLLSALGCTKTPYLIDRYLSTSMTHELKLRKQYRMTIVNAVLNGNPENVIYVIRFIYNNLHTILELRGIDFLTKILTAIGDKVITEIQLNQLRLFVDENIEHLGSALNSAKKAITVSTLSVKWINKFLPAIEKSLLFNYYRVISGTMLTMRSLLSLLLLLAACWASDPTYDDVPPQFIQESVDNYRLPSDVIPIEYNIKLVPTFESEKDNFTFEGNSEITLEIKKLTHTITFHAKDLTFFENGILLKYGSEGKPLTPKLTTDLQKDFVILTFDEELVTTKNAKLSLHYKGKLNEELRGFYKSSYQTKEGKTKWLATTQFEPVNARQAFPCWDEPQLKAHFTITITVPANQDYKAISNMLGTTTKETTIFKKTPKMSTYLVAFVVSDFAALSNEKGTFSVLAKPTVDNSSKSFAFEYGQKALEELNNFTNIDYYGTEMQMDKLDQIAIPDFAAGAMENWGLVTYREPRLLYTAGKTTTEEKQALATVIAHEFSHQWFGNLITCEWWNYIWLNEGFATFFQYYISDKAVPKLKDAQESWRLMEQFVIKNVQASSFVVDARSKSRALNPKTNVQTPTQIRSLFDDIAYKKGASILHMMYGFLTEPVFKKGLEKYLRDHMGDSVNSDNFFNDVENSDKKTVEEYLPKKSTLKSVMDNWVNEPGYPVITATWDNTTAGVLNITQERFFLVKSAKKSKTQWYIPINYVTEQSPREIMPADKKDRWMIPEESKSFNQLNNSIWILFNKDQTGYYRVNYDVENWQRLATYLNTKDYVNISAVNRAQLIDDALNLARAGHLEYKTALQVTLYLNRETDYIPWYAAVRAFNYLDTVLLGGNSYTAYHKYVASKIQAFSTSANYTGTEDGDHINKLSKVLALNTACKYGLKDCVEFVDEKLKEWLEKKDEEVEKNLSPDLRSGIICAGLRKAEYETWNTTLQKYKSSKDKDEQADILAGLGCASKETAQKFLALTLEESPDVDIFAAMNSICDGNAETFDILVQFINDNIEKVHKADKEDNSLLIALLNKLSNRVVTAEQYKELSLLIHGQLQETEKVEGFVVAIHNLAWIKTYRGEVEKWIVDNCKACENAKPDSASSITLTSFILIVSLLFTRFYYVSKTATFWQTLAEYLRNLIAVVLRRAAATRRLIFVFERRVSMAFLKVLVNVGLIFTVITALPVDGNSENNSSATVNYRLPDNVVPVHYDIELIPYIEEDNFTFDGKSHIIIEVRRATRDLSLHALDLTINEEVTSVVRSDMLTYAPTAHNYNNETQILTFHFDDELPLGIYSLYVQFVGILNDELHGFFRTSYINENGDKVWLAATHFEATWARRAFPCWDEPALKATFNISMKHRRNYTAVSNMPIRDQSNDEDDMIWTHFDTTPVMSTYLVAFVVSDYVRVPNADETLNMWCRAALAPYSKFAQEVAQKAREILIEYTNSTYQVPKVDHLAVPELTAGAMENWGLIIYREKDFAYNEEKDSLSHKQNVAVTAAHEMAHQWFGNLVSPLWWSHVWLNEGFAAFFEEHILNEIFKQWRILDLFLVTIQHSNLYTEIEDENVMPITFETNKPKEIQSLFSSTSYRKSPAILRMVQHTITAEVFRNGIIKYIHKHQFGSVTSDDLWNALQAALDESNVPHNAYKLKEVMDPWIKQKHYPLVRVTRNYETGEVILTQEHFRPKSKNEHTDSNKWWIPLNFATQTNPDFSNTLPTHWLRPQDKNISIDGIDPDDWVIVNVQQMGYYRVNYDDTNWRKIASYLNSDNYTKIHVLNRAQIIDDAYYLMITQHLDIEMFMDLANYLSRETDIVGLYPMFSVLELSLDFYDFPESNYFKQYMLRILDELIKNIGYEEGPGEDDHTKLKRYKILKWACHFGHSECKRRATVKLNEFLADPVTHKVPLDLTKWMYCNGIKGANVSTWNKVMDVYLINQDSDILGYLACSENPDIIINFINTSVSNYSTDDYYSIITNIADKHSDNDAVLDYMLANLEEITPKNIYIDKSEKLLNFIIRSVRSHERLDKIKEFVKSKYEDTKSKKIQHLIESHKSELTDYFNKFPFYSNRVQ
ncbi:PREDICTED: uncharacterized protein LOC105560735 [Vollenhovia emeryi]|uniref:uncharacterized protein LOC105560735 n=1 Tax=Vollenhovia emeryi TaxID=411798 RepID=UPI0005F42F15|nr:PREDICTED: uncharacterized protein LOC105560735 [Vollenhovia emeryi]